MAAARPAAGVSEVVARSPLTIAAYQKCSRTLAKGEVKRVATRGPLIGYFLACPACNFVASYLHEDDRPEKAAGFVEDPPAPGTLWPRRLTHITQPQPCYGCQAMLSVEDGHLVARRRA